MPRYIYMPINAYALNSLLNLCHYDTFINLWRGLVLKIKIALLRADETPSYLYTPYPCF